jgi:FixJ family two-component response regulator
MSLRYGRDKETSNGALRKSRLVFVVDDDLSTLKGLGRLLREHSFDTMLFSSAQELEDRNDFTQGICVVLDIQLNGVSGIELRYRLIEAGISLPVIYITASDNDMIRAAAMESGCVAYLTKPFPARSLIEPIQRAAAGLPGRR